MKLVKEITCPDFWEVHPTTKERRLIYGGYIKATKGWITLLEPASALYWKHESQKAFGQKAQR